MVIYNIINMLIFLATLCVGWWLYTELYQQYCVDLTRKKLFKLRDDLFDLGVDGKISFDSKAYGMCRKTINGMIRYCHRVSIYKVFVDLFIYARDLNTLKAMVKVYSETKDNAHKSLSEEQKVKIEQIYNNMHSIILVHLARTWLPLLIIWGIMRIVLRFLRIFETFRKFILTLTEKCLITLDARAKQYGASPIIDERLKVAVVR